MFRLVVPLDIKFLENCHSLLANWADTVVLYFSEKILQFPLVLETSSLFVNCPFFSCSRDVRNGLA